MPFRKGATQGAIGVAKSRYDQAGRQATSAGTLTPVMPQDDTQGESLVLNGEGYSIPVCGVVAGSCGPGLEELWLV